MIHTIISELRPIVHLLTFLKTIHIIEASQHSSSIRFYLSNRKKGTKFRLHRSSVLSKCQKMKVRRFEERRGGAGSLDKSVTATIQLNVRGTAIFIWIKRTSGRRRSSPCRTRVRTRHRSSLRARITRNVYVHEAPRDVRIIRIRAVVRNCVM